MAKLFGTTNGQVGRIAGTLFVNMTPEQKNRVRILSMLFNDLENTYHEGFIEEITEYAEKINIRIEEPVVEGDVTVFTFINAETELETGPTIEDKRNQVAAANTIEVELIENWPDELVERAFVNLRLDRKTNVKVPVVGFMFVDDRGIFPRFNSTTDSMEVELRKYNEFLDNEIRKSDTFAQK